MGETPHDSVPTPSFDVVLRGYDRAQVDEFVARLRAADGGTSPPERPAFAVVLRGYGRGQVDRWVSGATGAAPKERRAEPGGVRLPGAYSVPVFDVVLRGYDRRRVDPLLRRVAATLAGDGSTAPVTRSEVEGVELRPALLGYDRAQVDAWLKETLPRLPG